MLERYRYPTRKVVNSQLNTVDDGLEKDFPPAIFWLNDGADTNHSL
jgi:hypothetical protein